MTSSAQHGLLGTDLPDEVSPVSRMRLVWVVCRSDAEAKAVRDALNQRFETEIFDVLDLALEELKSRGPDVLVIEPSSAEAGALSCARVRRHYDAAALPILILTPSPVAPEDVESAFDSGAGDVMAIPFRPRELVARVGSLARVAHLARERTRLVGDLESAVARAREEHARAELANAMKDQFLATVSHELRTPLNAILGWTVLARQESPPSELDRVLSIIERNARTQSRLIEDVLDFARVATGKLRLELGPTNAGETIDAAVEAVRPSAIAKGVDLHIDVDERIGLLLADRERLQQIVWNLLTNAVKFTPKGGRVDLRAYRLDGEVTIVVRDTGPGIPSAFLKRLFEPFQQVDASQTRREGGLGLGLAIVKQLVAAHSGTIDVESEERRGTTFTIRLPAQDVPVVHPTAVPAGEPESTQLAATGRTLPRLDDLTIVVVEDDRDSREMLVRLLSQQGAHVLDASSALEALALFERAVPDVIVSDIGMPRVDGLSLLRKIRSLPPERGAGVPAIAASAFVRAEDARQAYAAGFQEHVAKPIDPRELLEAVLRVAGRRPKAASHLRDKLPH